MTMAIIGGVFGILMVLGVVDTAKQSPKHAHAIEVTEFEKRASESYVEAAPKIIKRLEKKIAKLEMGIEKHEARKEKLDQKLDKLTHDQ